MGHYIFEHTTVGAMGEQPTNIMSCSEQKILLTQPVQVTEQMYVKISVVSAVEEDGFSVIS